MHLPDTAFSAVGGYGTRAGPALVQEEVAAYKKRLDSSNVKYRIMSEEPQADGSVILMIKKQYNQSRWEIISSEINHAFPGADSIPVMELPAPGFFA